MAHTSTLTSNMHNLFTSFYRPTAKRWKIVIEQGSFPSDWVGFRLRVQIWNWGAGKLKSVCGAFSPGAALRRPERGANSPCDCAAGAARGRRYAPDGGYHRYTRTAQGRGGCTSTGVYCV